MIDLSHLSDEPPEHDGAFTKVETQLSDRLVHVLSHLPKYNRVRFTGAVYNYGVRTLAELCSKTPRELKKWRHVGKGCLHDIVTALASFGLALATSPSTAPASFRPRNLPMVVVRMEHGRPSAASGSKITHCTIGSGPNAEIDRLRELAKRIERDRHAAASELIESDLAHGLYRAHMEAQLAIMTTARDALADIADDLNGDNGDDEELERRRAEIASLRTIEKTVQKESA